MAQILPTIIICAIPIVCIPTICRAQDGNAGSPTVSDSKLSVAERPHPEYDPVPIHIGAFTALPRLSGGVEYNDNIYATTSDAHSDFIVRLDPELVVRSNWSRNSVEAFIRADSRSYLRFGGENTVDYQSGIKAQLEGVGGYLSVRADAGLLTEPRTSPDAFRSAVRPIQYGQVNLQVDASKSFARTKVEFRGSIVRLDFQDGRDSSGGVVFEDNRDRTVYTLGSQIDYAVSPRTSFYISGALNKHDYRRYPATVSIDRNSSGDELDLGIKVDLTNLIRLDVQGGYLAQRFINRASNDVSGLGGRASVVWLVTGLTTVTVTGSRSVQDSDDSGAAVYVSNRASVQVDHELLRNLVLTGRGGYEFDEYNGTTRKDEGLSAFVGARYLMNRLTSFNAGYNFQSFGSRPENSGPQYRVSQFTVSVALRF